VGDVLYTVRMILLGALAVIGVIAALFISARKRSVDVVSLVPPERDAEGPAVPQRLAAGKQAVRGTPPPLPAGRSSAAQTPRGIVAPDIATRKALHAGNRGEAMKSYAAQTGLSIEAARNTLDSIMSGAIAVESLTVAPVNVDVAIQNALRAGQKIEAIKLYREKTGLGLAQAKENIEAMMRGDTPAWGTGATSVDTDTLIQNALRAGNKIEAIKLYREKTGLGLKEAKDAIDAMTAGNAPPPSPASFGNSDDAIDAALRNDQLIQAIKLYREKTGLGLAEAKRAMETRREQLKR
jgi:ribosomal protein L7/L12